MDLMTNPLARSSLRIFSVMNNIEINNINLVNQTRCSKASFVPRYGLVGIFADKLFNCLDRWRYMRFILGLYIICEFAFLYALSMKPLGITLFFCYTDRKPPDCFVKSSSKNTIK